MDEYIFIRDSLTASGDTFSIRYSDDLKSQSFDPDTIQILKLVETYRHIDMVLDYSLLTDLETVRIMSDLAQKRFIETSS